MQRDLGSMQRDLGSMQRDPGCMRRDPGCARSDDGLERFRVDYAGCLPEVGAREERRVGEIVLPGA